MPDEQTMFVKNKNGELAVFETVSGKIISSTGKSRLYGAGSNAIFDETDNRLFDGSFNGELMAWSISPLKKVFSHTYENNMITTLARENKSYFAVVNPTVRTTEHGGSKLLSFSKLNDNEKRTWITPTEKELMDKHGNWKSIEDIDFNTTLSIAVQIGGLKEPPILVNLDPSTNTSKFVYLETKYQSVWSIASNDSIIISAVETSYYRDGMTSQQSQKAHEGVEKNHLFIHDKNNLELIDKVHWTGARGVSFSPDGEGLAVASYEKSAYISDYRKLSNEFTT